MTSSKKLLIELDRVSKKFTYWENSRSSIKTILADFSKFNFSKGKSHVLTVLDDVSLKIHEGEFVGIMGRNGVGKSTLLKIISAVYSPTNGEVRIHGKIAPLLELGAGFAPELSGHENIFLNAAILGYNRAETLKKVDEIIEFSELGDKIFMPVKNFSSGMLVRLGFAIATNMDAPILLFDEILAVGDLGFQIKCLNRINDLYKSGRTIVLVTHNPTQIEEYCNRCVVFDNKKIVFDGDPKFGVKVYQEGFPEAQT